MNKTEFPARLDAGFKVLGVFLVSLVLLWGTGCTPPEAVPPDCVCGNDCKGCDTARCDYHRTDFQPCRDCPTDCPGCGTCCDTNCPETTCRQVDVLADELGEPDETDQVEAVEEVEQDVEIVDVPPSCDGEPPCKTEGVCKDAPVCLAGGWFCDYESVEGFQWGNETLCDNKDNNCDGETDEEGTLDYEADCKDKGVDVQQGVCVAAVPVCINGDWGDCGVKMIDEAYVQGAYQPAGEIWCDGQDNNCDGEIDEGLCGDGCTVGERQCSSGKPQVCGLDGNWEDAAACVDEDELCMGKGLCTRKKAWQVNDEFASKQTNPVVATVGDDAVIAWQSSGQDGDLEGIYFKVIDETGWDIVVPETRANLFTLGAQQNPAVVALTDEKFFVGWESYEQDCNGLGLYGRVFDLVGNGSAELPLTQTVVELQKQLSLCPYGKGGAVTLWADEGALETPIMGGMIAGDGLVKPMEIQMTAPGADVDSAPVGVQIDDSQMVVVWQRKSGFQTDVFGKLVTNLAGSWQLGTELLEIAIDEQEGEGRPVVALSGSHLFVAWLEEISKKACVRRFDLNMEPAELECVTPALGNVRAVRLVPDVLGGVVVVWQEGTAANHSIALQLLDEDFKWGEKVVVEDASMDPDGAVAAVGLSAGKVLVVWTKDGGASGLDIWARFVQVD